MSPDGGSGGTGERGRAGRATETFLLAAVLGAMVLLASAQIVQRNVFGGGWGWADEALRLMVLWVTMLGAIAASGEQRHVSIDALSRYLPHRAGRVVARLIDALAAMVCALLAWYSWEFVAATWAAEERVLGGAVPAWLAQSILPAGFGLIALRHGLAALRGRAIAVRGTEGH